jgi:hypothetical protein
MIRFLTCHDILILVVTSSIIATSPVIVTVVTSPVVAALPVIIA